MRADSVRGHGLVQAHERLATLAHFPEALESDRRRFSASPLYCKSTPSGTTTRSGTPPAEEEIVRSQLSGKLMRERYQTDPYQQFLDQRAAEQNRLETENAKTTKSGLVEIDGREKAFEIVQQRWIEQGIWRDEWAGYPSNRWKHECPMEEAEHLDVAEVEAAIRNRKTRGRRKAPGSNKELRQITAESRAKLVREREASRPIHQFMFQLARERESLQGGPDSATTSFDLDINSVAYVNIRQLWESRDIWDDLWGILPGMIWKHEKNFDEELERLYREHGVSKVHSAPEETHGQNRSSKQAPEQRNIRVSRRKSNRAEGSMPAAIPASRKVSAPSKARERAATRHVRALKDGDTSELQVTSGSIVRKSPRLQDPPASKTLNTINSRPAKRSARLDSPSAKPEGISKSRTRKTRQTRS